MSGLSMKYWLSGTALPSLPFHSPTFVHDVSGLSPSSRLRRITMSVVTSVPAFLRKALFGRRIAPTRSAVLAICSRAASLEPSRKRFVTTIASTPPGRSVSIDFAKKKLWMESLLRWRRCLS
ncbi:unknown [Sinorhizobium phage PBC5]|nr:unknown [Sinorhizobium phage PBC5]